MVVVDVSFTPTSGDTRQLLTDIWPWILDDRWVYQAGVLYSGEVRRQTDPFVVHPLKGRVIKDGPQVYFDWGARIFAGTELVYLRCIKRAYDHIFGVVSGGTVLTATNARRPPPGSTS
jgi:hypothetical protein